MGGNGQQADLFTAAPALIEAEPHPAVEALRDIDSVGRVGGEEFAVVLPHTDSARALEVAERLRKTVERSEVALAHGMPLRFTLSIGVTTLVETNTNIDTLISQADSALYEAKHLGRNRVEVYTGQAARP